MTSQEPNPPILGGVLRTLELRDFAIVDDLAIELGPGLNVLTGETGAGKSIVIDALELLAGGRADVAMIRTGAETAMVQGEFAEHDLSSASRRLSVSGRHAARIDGELVSVAELSERCGERIAVFAQHGALELQSSTAQRAQLDRLLPGPARSALESFTAPSNRLSGSVSGASRSSPTRSKTSLARSPSSARTTGWRPSSTPCATPNAS
jgi:DNA repair protein RecN (Recombination protein N)